MNVLFFIIAFISEVVGTIAGFGSSTIALPISLLFLDFKTAIVLVAFLHIFGNIGRVSFFRFGFDKNILLKFGMISVLFSLVGALLVNYIPQAGLKGGLGVFLIIYSAISWSGTFKLKASSATALVGGTLSGFLAGLIGTGGALRAMFLSAFQLPKEKFIATAAIIALAVDAIRIPVYISGGYLDSNLYWLVPIIFVTAIAGSFVGKKIVDKIPQNFFRKVVLSAIFMVGVKFVIDWLL
ncbi:MAG: sulfonate transporter [Candidatus Magasanikbacteria bacterium RIFOXYD2_FULL_39_9]|uniref:Probable membrane transporter protein n=1 Tax=Candidatus Magasanikbacteria bacterium RIFOXYD1_FULL_40_23 TaxID=1798705 RepID=A0A1F6P9Q8_9BACT|nr:MAG: sulfonate transporter [Candidatus Magasanikbacteria bacterium RIFOXYD2_FULL_39_9]OGH92770.1 MAG: sulfonate transporter [Candidatus Magasanikbacteria bacterium RIFOXYD1_FULL_40_23]